MESCFGRALLKSPVKELPWKMIIPWILQIRLPTETQQTPNKAPKRLQPGLNLDTSFGDLNWNLMWRALLESSFGGPMNLSDFTCQNTKFNSIFRIFSVKKQI